MQPEKKFRAGLVSATIWKNQGAKGSYATVTLSRAYLDKENNWKDTNSYKATDLPRAALVLNEAFKYLQLKNGTENNQIQVTEQTIA